MARSKKAQNNYYIVREDVLPEVFVKVMEVKRLLDLKHVPTVNAAVRRVGISRSAYYKYRNAIRALKTLDEGAYSTMLVIMESSEQSVALCLGVFLEVGARIVALQQSPPVDGLIHMLVTFQTGGRFEFEEHLLYRLSETRSVIRVESLRQA